MTPIRFDFAYLAQDFEEGLRATTESKLHRVGGWLWVAVVGGIAAALILISRTIERQPASPPPTQEPGYLLVVLVALPWVLVCIFMGFMLYRLLRLSPHRVYRRSRELHEPQTLLVEESGVSLRGPTAFTHGAWDSFTGWRESEGVFVLLKPDDVMLIIPKRTATEQQLAQLRVAFSGRIASSGRSA